VLNAVQPGSLELGSKSKIQKFPKRRNGHNIDRSKAFDRVCLSSTEVDRPINRAGSAQKDYSKLAMQASKRMKFSKDKVRTGRLICLHLRSLLQQNPVDRLSVEDTEPLQTSVSQRMDVLEQRQVPLPL
jgi:hypothetical protein